ncbi:MAG: MFS transporter [Pseudomonadota bacterium]|jgi:DHA1 family bicyclomycin/chloramphenicol resistance-like MFS transporter|nr:MFS transporter [Alphaproteobacteria bacterium]
MLFVAVIFILFLAGMEVDIFIPSYPELQQQFNLSPATVQLCLSLNFLTYCIGSLYAGAFGDRYGLRRVILSGLLVFIAGSIFCSFANDFCSILIGRALQGLGMAAPASLGYVVICEQYPAENQAAMLGTLNGIITVGMALAPVIGSYVTLYAGWRGNFVILLALALIALLACVFVMPCDHRNNKDVSLPLISYKSVVISKSYWALLSIIFAYACSYWIFIGMGSILYIEGFGIPLSEFGFYQGAIAGSFGLISFLSPKFLSKIGHRKCLNISVIVATMVAIALGLVALTGLNNPLLITGLMCVFAMFIVMPVNILYPILLDVVPDTKSRAAALGNVMRLVISAVFIELVSYAYNGTFFHLGLVLFVFSMVGFFLARSKFISHLV